MDRITLRLSPSLARALEVRADRERLPNGKPTPAAAIARDALAFHLDRLSLVDAFGDRIAVVVDQQLQRLSALAAENDRLQKLVTELLARIDGEHETTPAPVVHDERTDRLLENLTRKGTRA